MGGIGAKYGVDTHGLYVLVTFQSLSIHDIVYGESHRNNPSGHSTSQYVYVIRVGDSWYFGGRSGESLVLLGRLASELIASRCSGYISLIR